MSKIAVTISEAAALSGLGKTSLYKLISHGRLTPRKMGKRTLVLVEDLDAMLKSLPTGR